MCIVECLYSKKLLFIPYSAFTVIKSGVGTIHLKPMYKVEGCCGKSPIKNLMNFKEEGNVAI